MKCEICKKYDDCSTGSGLVWPCGAYVSKILTNADRIRAMTDEELAFLLFDMQSYGDVEDDLLDWLRQPAKEEK